MDITVSMLRVRTWMCELVPVNVFLLVGHLLCPSLTLGFDTPFREHEDDLTAVA